MAIAAAAPSGLAEREEPTTRVVIALCVSAFLAALSFFAASPFFPQMSRDLARPSRCSARLRPS